MKSTRKCQINFLSYHSVPRPRTRLQTHASLGNITLHHAGEPSASRSQWKREPQLPCKGFPSWPLCERWFSFGTEWYLKIENGHLERGPFEAGQQHRSAARSFPAPGVRSLQVGECTLMRRLISLETLIYTEKAVYIRFALDDKRKSNGSTEDPSLTLYEFRWMMSSMIQFGR